MDHFEFSSIYNHCGVMADCSRKTLKKKSFFAFFPVPKGFIATSTEVLCSNSWNLADWKSIVVHYLP